MRAAADREAQDLDFKLRGTLWHRISGESDYTAEVVAKADPQLLSATALEALRDLAKAERAPDDLLKLADAELLDNLGLVKGGRFTRAALMLAGTEAAVREHLPGHNWTFLQMTSDTDYAIRQDGVTALPLAIRALEQLLVPFNPITTCEQGFYHFEYHAWPKVALREALMNAFCHADYRIAGPVLVKLHPDRLDISNNGGFIAGITPDNILRHQPAARNLLLVGALTRMRLVNRSNLGVNRIFSALLCEGKAPPVIRELGESVLVSIPKSTLNAPFRLFVTEESKHDRILQVAELLTVRHLLQHPELDLPAAATLCQLSESEAQTRLAAMQSAGYLAPSAPNRWCLAPFLKARLAPKPSANQH